jgi:putative Mg2+ transporter-C (MgtC) family protein
MHAPNDVVQPQHTMIALDEIILRLLAAVLFCGAVGLQRALTGKAAGMRTHILVGVGAAMFTLVSGHAFPTASTNADRIASNIVTGIGFIGGGAILKEKGSIRGLTTAAGIWAAAALGMAAGAGLYVLGAAGTVVILATLVALRRIELRFPRRSLETWSIDLTLQGGATLEQIYAVIKPIARTVALTGLNSEDATRLSFAVEIPHHLDLVRLSERLREAGARAVRWEAQGGAEVEESL